MSEDAELQAVSRLTRILIDLRTDSGDRVAERALAYAAARAGIELPIIRLSAHPARKAAWESTPNREPAPDSPAEPSAARTPRRPERPIVAHAPNSTRGPDYPRPCPYCGQTIGSAGGWSMHVRSKHPDKSRAWPADVPPPAPPAQPATRAPSAPVSHWPAAVPCRCPYCDQRLGSTAGLARHYQMKHPDRPRIPGRPLVPEPGPEPADATPAPEPLPFEDRPARFPCPHCGKEFLTQASCDGHTGRCLVAHPAAAPAPITLVAGPPDEGSLAYHWRKAWPRPCPECWRVGSVWEAAGPRAMADHRFHHHAIPMDAGHRLHQSLAAAPAAPSKDARGWSCAICRSAAFARYRESDTCVRCAAPAPATRESEVTA